MKILLSREVKPLRSGIRNAKDYPFWDGLDLSSHEVKEIKGIVPIEEIIEMVNWCDVWISIDSFLPHLVHYYGLKPGIVLWGKSDPLIFGYPENKNLLKDRKYLRKLQFHWWEDEPHSIDVFVRPRDIQEAL